MDSGTSFLINKDSPIVQAIRERAECSGETDMRLLLLIGGGGMASIYSAGVLTALEALGLTKAFDIILGVSAGAINSAFFCSGQTQLLSDLYCKDFVNCVNAYKPWNFYDINAVQAFIRSKLDLSKTMNSRASLYVSATNIESGQGELLNVKDGNMVERIMASSTPAVGWNSFVQVGDKKYMDGEIALPLPMAEAYKLFLPTHVLIILNRPNTQTHPSLPAWLKNIGEIFMKWYNPILSPCYSNWSSNYIASLACVESLAQKIPIGVISPAKGISELCFDRGELNETFSSAVLSTLDIFTKAPI